MAIPTYDFSTPISLVNEVFVHRNLSVMLRQRLQEAVSELVDVVVDAAGSAASQVTVRDVVRIAEGQVLALQQALDCVQRSWSDLLSYS